MSRLLRLALMLVLLVACRSSETRLQVVFPEGNEACSQQTDLSCVNFLQFTVDDGQSFSTHCIKVSRPLVSLCDLAGLADGSSLFSLDSSSQVRIELKGMRVFPATSCDVQQDCPPRVIFSGTTASIKIGDYNGKSIDLPVTMSLPCGKKEQFFLPPEKESCADICGFDAVVCEIQKGCLCLAP